MKQIKKIFLLIPLVIPFSTLMYSCSSMNYQNNHDFNKESSTNNLTKEQVKFLNKNNIDLIISTFNDLLVNKTLNLNIFPNLEIIDKETFLNKKIEYINFNNKLKVIKESAFSNINSLK